MNLQDSLISFCIFEFSLMVVAEEKKLSLKKKLAKELT